MVSNSFRNAKEWRNPFSGVPEFILIPAQTYQGKRYRKRSYFADFQYVDNEGNTVVEDVEGVSKGRSGISTDTFIIKQKLLIQIYGKDIVFG